jgi:PAS domain S-box-containing protein
MYNFFRQNKNILLVSLGVFIVSMTMLLVFLNSENKEASELKADVINSDPMQEQDKESKYRELFQNQEDMVLAMGLDGKITFASKNVEAASGFSEKDMEDTLLSGYMHPDDLPVFFAAFGKVIATGKPVTMIGPLRMRDLNGEYHYTMGSVYPVLEENKVAGIGITVKDISDHLDQYLAPEQTEVQVETPEPADVEEVDVQAPVKTYQPVKHKTYLKKSEPVKDQPAATEPVKWKKPKKIKNDPNWITGERIVMMLPFRLPLFPAHLLLAQL